MAKWQPQYSPSNSQYRKTNRLKLNNVGPPPFGLFLVGPFEFDMWDRATTCTCVHLLLSCGWVPDFLGKFLRKQEEIALLTGV